MYICVVICDVSMWYVICVLCVVWLYTRDVCVVCISHMCNMGVVVSVWNDVNVWVAWVWPVGV